MSNDDPTPVLFCPPVSRQEQRRLHLLDFVASPGSVQGTCSRCHQAIWVGPTQLQFIAANPQVQTLCPVCLLADPAIGTSTVKSLGGKGGTYLMDDGRVFAPDDGVN